MVENKVRKPYFSIVMPSYNAGRYLERSVRCILNQTYSDFELIIVNDGSEDDTLQLAERLAARDARIRIVDLKKNRGLSNARNVGTEYACGYYIWYVDADDYFESYLLEKVFESLQKHPVRMVMFGLNEEYLNKDGKLIEINETRPEYHVYTDIRELRQSIISYEQNLLIGYAWNKVFDLGYLKQEKLEFENVPLIEDVLFTYAFIKKITTMTVLDIVPYHYEKKVENNLTNAFVPEYFKVHRTRILSLYNLYKEWNEITPEFLSRLGSLYARYILSAVERTYDTRAKFTIGKRLYWIRRIYNDWLFREIVHGARPEASWSLYLMIRLMETENPFLLAVAGWLVHLIRRIFPRIYILAKEGR